jgi:hypothetical protein
MGKHRGNTALSGRRAIALQYIQRTRNEHRRPCSARREGDESVCHCGTRWTAGSDRPQCIHEGSY